MISRVLIAVPSGFQEAYGVSHQRQRRLQPEVRMKMLGTPGRIPSPWTE